MHVEECWFGQLVKSTEKKHISSIMYQSLLLYNTLAQ